MFILLLLQVAAASSPAQNLIGCWDVGIGAWRPALSERDDRLYLRPPARVRLTADPSPTGGDALLIEPAPGAMPSVHWLTHWSRAHTDTIRLVWSTGFLGLTMKLTPDGDVLRGVARAFSDVFSDEDRDYASASAELRATDCHAPLLPADSARYRYVRGIALARGDSIRLNEPLPAGLDTIRRERGGVLIDGQDVVGIFAGADSVMVKFDRYGDVGGIAFVLRRADAHDVSRVLADAIGAPTRRADARSQSSFWASRMVDIAVLQRAGFVEVRITDPSFW